MKLKVNVSLLLALLLIMNQFAFASNGPTIKNYENNLATDNFTQGFTEDDWYTSNASIEKAVLNGEDSLVVDITKANHYVRRYTETVNSGIVVSEFDLTNPNYEKWLNSFEFGLVNGKTSNIQLFSLTSAGNFRSSIDEKYANLKKIDVTKWTTIKIVYDFNTRIFEVYAGDKGKTLEFVEGLATNFYKNQETDIFADGIKGFYVKSSSQPALNAAYYIDNVNINQYESAFAGLNKIENIQEAEDFLLAYEDAGIITLPKLYYEIDNKNEILQKLIGTNLTSDSQINDIISANYSKFEEKVYADLSSYFDNDTIGKLGDSAELNKFGVFRLAGHWMPQGGNDPKDNYLGQGYNGAEIKKNLDSNNLLTFTSKTDPTKTKTIKFNPASLSAGVNDTFVLRTTGSKDSDGYCISENNVVVELSGKNLSAIDLAVLGGSYNPPYIGADITYTDGSVVTYFDGTYCIPLMGDNTSSTIASDRYVSADFGKAVYNNENNVIAYDERPLNTSGKDTRTKTYMFAMSIPMDISKKAQSIKLYAKTRWGGGSYGVFGLTEVTATNDELISAVKGTDYLSEENINLDTDGSKIEYASRCAKELISRGIYSQTGSKVKRLETLKTAFGSYDKNYVIITEATLFDANGVETGSVSAAKTVSVNLKYNNKNNESKKIVAFVGFYDENEALLGLSDFEVKDIGKGTGSDSFEKIALPAGTEKIRVFAWEDFVNISPRNSLTVIGG